MRTLAVVVGDHFDGLAGGGASPGPLTIRLYSGYKSGQERPKIGRSPRNKSGQKRLRGVNRQILVRTGLSRRKVTPHMSAGQPQDAAMV